MKLWSILFVSVATVGLIEATIIPSDQIVPFKEPTAVTDTEKSGVLFKPTLLVTSGCYPYAAVEAGGGVNDGYSSDFDLSGICKGSSLGSQIYGRATLQNDIWAIMYAWHFNYDVSPDKQFDIRNKWTSVVIWIDNPAVEEPTIIGVATSWFIDRYNIHNPLPADSIEGHAIKIEYIEDPDSVYLHNLNVTSKPGGKFQDLIMWEHMTEEARNALNNTDFGAPEFGGPVKVPFIDVNFAANLDLAWPRK